MSGAADSTPTQPIGIRGPGLLDRVRGGGVPIASASTIVVFGILGLLIVTAPGWPVVQRAFFSSEIFSASFPDIAAAFLVNVRMFLLAEVLILLVALVLAVMRSLPGAVFFPFRLMAVAYIDFFRGVPGVLVIFLLGLGVPGLQLPGVTNDLFFWGLVSLVLVWSAYVAEVYRAGIEAVHPSQDAAARSLGLSRVQSLRYVVLPQAVRRVTPALLNDFIGLQKDTALVSFVGVIEVFRRTQIEAGGSFNFTPYLACALIFLVLTIPMARLVDWLALRDRRRILAAGGIQ
jgi:polar amino acid transport system permease protein